MTMYLTLDKGTMFGGKSSRLYKLYLQYTRKKNPHRQGEKLRILVVKHKMDNRYSVDHIVTHDGHKIPCTPMDNLLSIDVDQWDVIIIDEAQWFSDLYQFIESNFRKNVRVHVAGLNGDKDQRNFGQVNMISPFCSEEHRHCGICIVCGDTAPFSKYRGESRERDNVGNDYYTVCYKHIDTPINEINSYIDN
jgi:thymidine kinase